MVSEAFVEPVRRFSHDIGPDSDHPEPSISGPSLGRPDEGPTSPGPSAPFADYQATELGEGRGLEAMGREDVDPADDAAVGFLGYEDGVLRESTDSLESQHRGILVGRVAELAGEPGEIGHVVVSRGPDFESLAPRLFRCSRLVRR